MSEPERSGDALSAVSPWSVARTRKEPTGLHRLFADSPEKSATVRVDANEEAGMTTIAPNACKARRRVGTELLVIDSFLT